MFLAISADLCDVIHQRGTGQQHPLGEEGRLSCEVQLQWSETVRGFGLGIQRFPVRRQGVLRLCWLLVLGAGAPPRAAVFVDAWQTHEGASLALLRSRL